MKIYLQKKLMAAYTLAQLCVRLRTMRKALKDPKVWIRAQNKEIADFVKYIYGIPFYRARFDAAGITPEDIKTGEDFCKLPPLTKAEYRAWILEETKNQAVYKDWMRSRTTGSTGTPLELYVWPADRAAEIANLFRCAYLQGAGYHVLTDKIFSTMAGASKRSGRWSVPRTRQESSTSSPEALLAAYEETKPDFYYGNKTAIQMIAQEAYAQHKKLHAPKCLGSISEKLDDNARSLINQVFFEASGTPSRLFDIYGCAETGNFAAECWKEPGKHIIWYDTHVVNVYQPEVSEDGMRQRGQLMLTSMIHHGFPVVNYLLGDEVEVTLSDGVKSITEITGRCNDQIKNRDGSSFRWMQISRLMYGLTEIRQFRVIQKSYDTLQFIIAAGISPARQQEIEAVIRKRAEALFGVDQYRKHLTFMWTDRILPDPSGKVRMLVSEIEA